MRFCLLSLIVWLLFTCLLAPARAQQRSSLSGKVLDSAAHTALPMATVAMLEVKDSSLITYTLSDEKGSFKLHSVPAGRPFRLFVSFTGYRSYSKIMNIAPGSDQQQNIFLPVAPRELNTVEITGEKPPISIRKDTIEFNAAAFKTRPNAVVEDLLKNLPGVEVDKDGNITMNGKKVSRIMVDGREFFGNDPKIASKNLPVNIIDKVQVTDTKTKADELQGKPADGEDKTINLTLKADKKKGLFGRISAGAGTDSRYDASGMVNFFDGPRQISILGAGNNTNNVGFTMSEISDMVTSGGGKVNSMMVSSDGTFGINNISFGSPGSGIKEARNGGINYNDNFGSKVKVNGSYFYSHVDDRNNTRRARQNILPDSTFYYDEQSNGVNANDNNRFNLNINYDIDSNSTLVVRPVLGITDQHSRNNRNAQTLADDQSTLLNTSNSTNTTEGKRYTFANDLNYVRRFGKKGRNISLSFYNSYNTMNGTGSNLAENIFYEQGQVSSREDINQRSRMKNRDEQYRMSLSYMEPLGNGWRVNLQYGMTFNSNSSDKETFRYNETSKEYDVIDSTYSNRFTNKTTQLLPGISFLYENKKLNASFGTNVSVNSLDNYSFYQDSRIQQRQTNIAPNARLQYRWGKGQSLNLYYNGSTQQPTVDQLQPVPDNSNPLYIREGNPDLKTSFNQSLSLGYNSFTPEQVIFSGVNFNPYYNRIVNEVYYDDKGRQVSRAINVNGTYTMSGYFNYSWRKNTATQKFSLSPGISLNYGKNTTYTNRQRNDSRSLGIRPRLNTMWSWKQLLDVNVQYSLNYQTTSYSLQQSNQGSFVSHNAGLNATLYWPRNFVWENDINYNYNSNIAPGFRKGVTLWNMALSRQLFKKQQGEVRLSVYDLLRQNTSVRRNMGDTYIEDTQTAIVQQYYMLSFIYRFSGFGLQPKKRERRSNMPFFF